MVVNAQAAAFAPAARPRVVIAGDGTLAAIHEPSRVVVIEIPTCSPFAELGVDAAATSTDVAWVGTPPRLLVLSRYSAHSMAYLVDPFGPRTIAEVRIEAPVTLFASVGNHGLVVGPLGAGLHGAAVLAASDRALSLHQFPARAQPVTAGAAGTNFLVALPGSIEEWDPQNRMPKRRLKLPRPVTVTAVGGSDRVVWMTTREEPARIDVMPLVNRGQPKAHDLPEPIASVSSHPRSDLVVCVGETTGRVWVIDLDGRHGLRMIGPEGIAKVEAVGLVLGRMTGVLAAQADHPITIVGLDRDNDASGPVAVPRDAQTQSSGASASRDASGPLAATREPFGDRAGGAEPSRERSGPIARPSTADALPHAVPPATRPPARPFAAGAAATARSFEPTPMTDLVVRSSLYEQNELDAPPTAVTLSAPPLAEADPGPRRSDPAPDRRRSDPEHSRHTREQDAFAAARESELAMTSARARGNAMSPDAPQLAAWRDRMKRPRARTIEAAIQFWPDAPPTWRDDALAWARSVIAGERPTESSVAPSSEQVAVGSPFASSVAPASEQVSAGSPFAAEAAPTSDRFELSPDSPFAAVAAPTSDRFELSPDSPFAALVARFDLSAQLQPVLALLYGLHLAGIAGASPAVIAKLTGAWDEALGRGELAHRGVALYRDSRIVLAPSVQRVLDDLPPSTGTLVGIPGICSLLGPCTIVAAGPLSIIAEACSSSIGGAILAAHGNADPAELAREAKAYGAAPMIRVMPQDLERISTDDPIILVVDDDATADALGIPRLT